MEDGMDLSKIQIAPEIVRQVPAALAHTYLVLPLREEGDVLILVVHVPPDPEKEDHLRFVTNRDLQYVEVPLMSLKYAIWRYYGMASNS